jgi:phage baseplate assembly protein gpV
MYATSADASLTMTFNEAQEYAAKLDAHGHKDWRVPTKAELNVLFNNRAAIGGFNVTGSHPVGWYWSASPDDKWDAWCQRLSDGAQFNRDKLFHLSVRPVR